MGEDGGDPEGSPPLFWCRRAHHGERRTKIPFAAEDSRRYIGVSAPLFPQGKQKRDQAQPRQDRRGGESRGRDFRPGLKTFFEPRSHADQEGKQRHVEEDYAKRFFGLGRDLHRRNCRTSVPDANLNRAIASNFEPRSTQRARRDYA
jgi:hypothetical protein